MRRSVCFRMIAVTAMFVSCLAAHANGQAVTASASEHFLIDHNRIFIELEFVRADGTLRKTLAFVDTGDQDLEFSLPFAKALHISKGRDAHVRFGGMDLKVSPDISVDANPGDSMLPGMIVEANLPATVLDQYDVLLDYGNQTLTLTTPGTLKHEGVRVPCKVNPKTGLISVQASVAGQQHAFAIDNGAAYTWIDRTVTEKWAITNPRWARGVGAVGDANMNGALPELTGMIMRVPAIDLGGLQIESVGALGVGPGWNKAMPSFFKWYSEKTPEPVVGFLGGNVLRAFRLEIDYANGATYWNRERTADPHDLDQVGIMIRAAHGKYFVAAVATQDGRKTVDGVRVNDQLISVDGVAMTGATPGKVLGALHGRPGQTHKLVLERDGKRIVVNAPVTRF